MAVVLFNMHLSQAHRNQHINPIIMTGLNLWVDGRWGKRFRDRK